jgi:hypothetical protein
MVAVIFGHNFCRDDSIRKARREAVRSFGLGYILICNRSPSAPLDEDPGAVSWIIRSGPFIPGLCRRCLVLCVNCEQGGGSKEEARSPDCTLIFHGRDEGPFSGRDKGSNVDPEDQLQIGEIGAAVGGSAEKMRGFFAALNDKRWGRYPWKREADSLRE